MPGVINTPVTSNAPFCSESGDQILISPTWHSPGTWFVLELFYEGSSLKWGCLLFFPQMYKKGESVKHTMCRMCRM